MSAKIISAIIAVGAVGVALGFTTGQRLMATDLANDSAAAAANVPAASDPIELQDLSDAVAMTEELLPLALVTDGAAPEIVEITDIDARLVFRSTVPLACSVVYGESEEFGMVATDADMAGAAIIDHDPLLTGLTPDTLYYYRVQGTAPDGSLYLSEVMQFRSAPAQVVAAEPPTRATGDPRLEGVFVSAVSSSYGNAANDQPWGANQAIDDNVRSAWSSNGDGDDAFLELDLGGPALVSAIELWSRTMSDGSAQIYSFTLTGDDGVAHGPYLVPDVHMAHRIEVDIETTKLRLDVENSSGGNTGLVEFAVFGSRP